MRTPAATPFLVLLPHLVASQDVPTSCATLSTSTPNWRVTNGASSDWPGSGAGRVNFFVVHVPTGEESACDVEYAMDPATGAVVDHDAEKWIECLNFGDRDVKTAVKLDMEDLGLTVRTTWSCGAASEEGGEVYTAEGQTTLDRSMEPDNCLVEPNLQGNATTCGIANAEITGTLETAS